MRARRALRSGRKYGVVMRMGLAGGFEQSLEEDAGLRAAAVWGA